MAGPRQVVLDGARDRLRRQRVAEAPEQLAQLVGGQQVEQHQHVGLLGDLVVIHRAAFGLEDPVEPLDVTVASAIFLPVDLRQVAVTLELADHAVLADRDVHPHRGAGRFGNAQVGLWGPGDQQHGQRVDLAERNDI